jgi:hypothetical protein
MLLAPQMASHGHIAIAPDFATIAPQVVVLLKNFMNLSIY